MRRYLNAVISGVAIVICIGASQVQAEPRSKSARARIAAGEKSGELTQLEAHYLREQQRALRAQRRQFMADGQMSPIEQRVHKRDKRHAQRSIRRETQDQDRR